MTSYQIRKQHKPWVELDFEKIAVVYLEALSMNFLSFRENRICWADARYGSISMVVDTEQGMW
jgi:hypothetical protein